jgi:hypothetical protein
MSRVETGVDAPRQAEGVITWCGLLLLTLVTVGPLLVLRRPVGFVPAYANPAATWAAEAGVLVILGLVLAVRAFLDRYSEPRPFLLALGLAALAGGMSAIHWNIVDSDPNRLKWQRDEIYLGVLNSTDRTDPTVPHRYRPLPYGFARLLEWATGDFLFAIVVCRWFFTWWFLWGAYRLARLFLQPAKALVSLIPLAVLYPFSVLYYKGQLTDPLSHALFMLALIWVFEDRPGPLAAALALGVAAKETAVVLVVVYFVCWWRRGLRTWVISAGLGLACVAAFLAVRLPQGWRLGMPNVNGLERLMIGSNLGFGPQAGWTTVPLWANYVHPLLFVGPFLPPLIWGWCRLDHRLRAACIALVPLLLVSNLCFGWMYESRNYMPLVPLLATAVLAVTPKGAKKCAEQDGSNPDEDSDE